MSSELNPFELLYTSEELYNKVMAKSNCTEDEFNEILNFHNSQDEIEFDRELNNRKRRVNLGLKSKEMSADQLSSEFEHVNDWLYLLKNQSPFLQETEQIDKSIKDPDANVSTGETVENNALNLYSFQTSLVRQLRKVIETKESPTTARLAELYNSASNNLKLREEVHFRLSRNLDDANRKLIQSSTENEDLTDTINDLEKKLEGFKDQKNYEEIQKSKKYHIVEHEYQQNKKELLRQIDVAEAEISGYKIKDKTEQKLLVQLRHNEEDASKLNIAYQDKIIQMESDIKSNEASYKQLLLTLEKEMKSRRTGLVASEKRQTNELKKKMTANSAKDLTAFKKGYTANIKQGEKDLKKFNGTEDEDADKAIDYLTTFQETTINQTKEIFDKEIKELQKIVDNEKAAIEVECNQLYNEKVSTVMKERDMDISRKYRLIGQLNDREIELKSVTQQLEIYEGILYDMTLEYKTTKKANKEKKKHLTGNEKAKYEKRKLMKASIKSIDYFIDKANFLIDLFKRKLKERMDKSISTEYPFEIGPQRLPLKDRIKRSNSMLIGKDKDTKLGIDPFVRIKNYKYEREDLRQTVRFTANISPKQSPPSNQQKTGRKMSKIASSAAIGNNLANRRMSTFTGPRAKLGQNNSELQNKIKKQQSVDLETFKEMNQNKKKDEMSDIQSKIKKQQSVDIGNLQMDEAKNSQAGGSKVSFTMPAKQNSKDQQKMSMKPNSSNGSESFPSMSMKQNSSSGGESFPSMSMKPNTSSNDGESFPSMSMKPNTSSNDGESFPSMSMKPNSSSNDGESFPSMSMKPNADTDNPDSFPSFSAKSDAGSTEELPKVPESSTPSTPEAKSSLPNFAEVADALIKSQPSGDSSSANQAEAQEKSAPVENEQNSKDEIQKDEAADSANNEKVSPSDSKVDDSQEKNKLSPSNSIASNSPNNEKVSASDSKVDDSYIEKVTASSSKVDDSQTPSKLSQSSSRASNSSSNEKATPSDNKVDDSNNEKVNTTNDSADDSQEKKQVSASDSIADDTNNDKLSEPIIETDDSQNHKQVSASDSKADDSNNEKVGASASKDDNSISNEESGDKQTDEKVACSDASSDISNKENQNDISSLINDKINSITSGEASKEEENQSTERSSDDGTDSQGELGAADITNIFRQTETNNGEGEKDVSQCTNDDDLLGNKQITASNSRTDDVNNEKISASNSRASNSSNNEKASPSNSKVDEQQEQKQITPSNSKVNDQNNEKISPSNSRASNSSNNEKITASNSKVDEQQKQKQITASNSRTDDVNTEKISASNSKVNVQNNEKITASNSKVNDQNNEKISQSNSKPNEQNNEKITASNSKADNSLKQKPITPSSSMESDTQEQMKISESNSKVDDSQEKKKLSPSNSKVDEQEGLRNSKITPSNSIASNSSNNEKVTPSNSKVDEQEEQKLISGSSSKVNDQNDEKISPSSSKGDEQEEQKQITASNSKVNDQNNKKITPSNNKVGEQQKQISESNSKVDDSNNAKITPSSSRASNSSNNEKITPSNSKVDDSNNEKISPSSSIASNSSNNEKITPSNSKVDDSNNEKVAPSNSKVDDSQEQKQSEEKADSIAEVQNQQKDNDSTQNETQNSEEATNERENESEPTQKSQHSEPSQEIQNQDDNTEPETEKQETQQQGETPMNSADEITDRKEKSNSEVQPNDAAVIKENAVTSQVKNIEKVTDIQKENDSKKESLAQAKVSKNGSTITKSSTVSAQNSKSSISPSSSLPREERGIQPDPPSSNEQPILNDDDIKLVRAPMIMKGKNTRHRVTLTNKSSSETKQQEKQEEEKEEQKEETKEQEPEETKQEEQEAVVVDKKDDVKHSKVVIKPILNSTENQPKRKDNRLAISSTPRRRVQHLKIPASNMQVETYTIVLKSPPVDDSVKQKAAHALKQTISTEKTGVDTSSIMHTAADSRVFKSIGGKFVNTNLCYDPDEDFTDPKSGRVCHVYRHWNGETAQFDPKLDFYDESGILHHVYKVNHLSDESSNTKQKNRNDKDESEDNKIESEVTCDIKTIKPRARVNSLDRDDILTPTSREVRSARFHPSLSGYPSSSTFRWRRRRSDDSVLPPRYLSHFPNGLPISPISSRRDKARNTSQRSLRHSYFALAKESSNKNCLSDNDEALRVTKLNEQVRQDDRQNAKSIRVVADQTVNSSSSSSPRQPDGYSYRSPMSARSFRTKKLTAQTVDDNSNRISEPQLPPLSSSHQQLKQKVVQPNENSIIESPLPKVPNTASLKQTDELALTPRRLNIQVKVTPVTDGLNDSQSPRRRRNFNAKSKDFTLIRGSVDLTLRKNGRIVDVKTLSSPKKNLVSNSQPNMLSNDNDNEK